MTDIRLSWGTANADFAIAANDIATDEGLETAILLSLFTDRRAEDNDVLPDGETDRRGWWADEFSPVSGDRIGSRLWLLGRSKQTQETLSLSEEYSREALAWLLEDKVAASVDVSAVFPKPGAWGVGIKVVRPDGREASFKFNRNWDALS